MSGRQVSDTLGSVTVQQLIGGMHRHPDAFQHFSKLEQNQPRSDRSDDSAAQWVMLLFFGLLFAALSIDNEILTKDCDNKKRKAVFIYWAAVFAAVSSTYGLFRMRRSIGKMLTTMFSAQ